MKARPESAAISTSAILPLREQRRRHAKRPPIVRSESLGQWGQDARISAESGSGGHRAPDAAALSAGLRLPWEHP